MIDVDSTICEVAGKAKGGAAFGYTKVLGYHPDTRHPGRHRRGVPRPHAQGSANTARGARRFIDELVARLRRAGASGEMVMRFDSGFWSKETIATLGRLDVRYTMAVRTNTKGVAAAIAAMDPEAWGRHRLHRRRPSAGGRVQLPGPTPDRAPHPAHGHRSGSAVA